MNIEHTQRVKKRKSRCCMHSKSSENFNEKSLYEKKHTQANESKVKCFKILQH